MINSRTGQERIEESDGDSWAFMGPRGASKTGNALSE